MVKVHIELQFEPCSNTHASIRFNIQIAVISGRVAVNQLLFGWVLEHFHFLFVHRVDVEEVDFRLEHGAFHHLATVEEPIEFVLPVDFILGVDGLVLGGGGSQVESDTFDSEVVDYLGRALDNGITPERGYEYLELIHLVLLDVGSVEETIGASERLLHFPARRIDSAAGVAIEDDVHVGDVVGVLAVSVVSTLGVVIQSSLHSET